MSSITNASEFRQPALRKYISLVVVVAAVGAMALHAFSQFKFLETDLEPRLETVRDIRAATSLPARLLNNPAVMRHNAELLDSLTHSILRDLQAGEQNISNDGSRETAFQVLSVRKSVDDLLSVTASASAAADTTPEAQRNSEAISNLVALLHSDIALRSERLEGLTKAAIDATMLNLQAAVVSLSVICAILAILAIYSFSARRKKHVIRVLALHELNQNLRMQVDEFKSVRDELERTIDHYRSIIDSIPEGIAVLDSEGEIVFRNPEFAICCPDDPSNIDNFAGVESARQLNGAFKKALDDGLAAIEIEHSSKNHRRSLNLRLKRLEDRDGSVIGAIVAVRDTTVEKNRTRHVERIAEIAKSLSLPVIVETADGKIQFINRSAESLLGFRCSDIEGEPLSLFVTPDRIAEFRAKRKRAIEDGDNEFVESVFVTNSGDELEVTLSISRVIDGNDAPDGLVSTIVRHTGDNRDGCDTHDARTLQKIFDVLPAAVAIVKDHQIVFATNAMVEMLRAETVDQAVGTDIRDLVHPDFRTIAERRLSNLQNPGSHNKPVELKLRGLDGSDVWVESSSMELKLGDDDVICIFGHDLTQQKETQIALKESDSKLRNAFDKAPVAAAIVAPNFNILRVNDAFCAIAGYSTEELREMRLFDLTHTDDEAEESDRLAALASGDIEQYSADKRLVRKDGSSVWVNQAVRLVRDSDGAPLYYLPLIHDITRIREAQAALKESEKQYRTLVENAGEGILVVADERVLFANPYVSRIIGYSEDELKDIPFHQFVHPDDLERVARNHRRRVSGDTDIPVYEFRIVDQNGKTLWVEIEGVPIEWNGKPAALNFLRDVTERRRTEEALKESEDKYRNLFQNAQVGLFRTAISDGRVLECNDRAAFMFGFDSREEVVDRVVIGQMWLNPESRAFMIQQLNSAGEVRGFETRVRKKDGSVVWVRFSAKAFPEYGWLEGVVEDISDRKAMEQALWESEKLLAEVFNSIQDAIYVLDPDKTIIRSNLGTNALFGLSENPVGHKCSEILLGDDRECECCSARTAMETGRLQTSLSRVETSDGRLIWCEFSNYPMTDDNGKVIGVVEYARDVTDRIRAEKALAESEQKYKALTENSTDMIVRIDSDRRCIYANVAAVNEFELEPDTILGRTPEEIGMPDDILALMTNGGDNDHRPEPRRIQFEMETRSGRKWYDSSVIPELDDDGKLISYITIWRDITRLKQLQDFASRAERLETAGRIAGQVAHDFNNLLGPMIAYPELIREEMPEGHSAARYVEYIQKAAEQMTEINQQLLTLGRRGHYNQSIINLNDLMRNVLTQLGAPPDTLTLEFRPDPSLLRIKGGGSQVFRALSNLIVNARDAMNDVGTLSIETQNLVKPGYNCDSFLLNSNLPDGKYVKVSIADTGHGIPSEIQSQIFDPFFTTKSTDKKRGSGLGLSVVHSVVEDHHGAIELETTEGRGTTFNLYFPATRETKIEDTHDQLAGGSEKVLVVDDDEIQREVTSRLLTRLNYTVVTADSGEAAVEMVQSESFDLVLLDMIMPDGIDGTETYRRILETNADQRAIIMSGFAESERVQIALELGASMFLKKPLKLSTLSSAIREVIDFQRGPKSPSNVDG